MTKMEGNHENRRRSPSLFGPVLLIAVGVYFLLENMGVVSGLNWYAALRLWPLLLIFGGLNIIVRQAPRPFGGFLSFLVALAAVAVFGFVMLGGEDNALLSRFDLQTTPVYQTETVAFAGDGLETAVVRLDFNSDGAAVYALEDNPNLIAGTVHYTGDLTFDAQQTGDTANVYLDTNSFGFLNWGGGWGLDDNQWDIGLSASVPMDLRLDLSSGKSELDLAQLSLTGLDIDASSGAVQLALPSGAYDVRYEASSGAATIDLPQSGTIFMEVDSSSGRIAFDLPAGMAARVEVVDASSGALQLSSRFSLVDGQVGEEGVWETDDYGRNDNSIELILDMSSGAISID